MPSEFAPGIKDRLDKGDLSLLPVGEEVRLVRQLHDAKRAGRHEDFRVGTPSGLYSWAVPKGMPEKEGEKRLAVMQPIHSWGYKDFEGRLGHGYGEGTVRKLEESPLVLLGNEPGTLEFTRGDKKDSPSYVLRNTKGNSWILFRKRRPSSPDPVAGYGKEHFKSIPVSDASKLLLSGWRATPKVDGAGALVYAAPGKKISVWGIRDDKSGNKPDYSRHMPEALARTKVDKPLLLRGELFGVDPTGRSIPVNELSGILNSTTLKSICKQRSQGIRLMLAALAVNENGKDDYDEDKVRRAVQALDNPRIAALPSLTGEKAVAMLRRIGAGESPLTEEGIVLHSKSGRPVKAKFTEDSDVIIRRVFPAETSDDSSRAGGFEYSLPGSDAIVGRVGSGFSRELAVDMLKDPDSYIGRTARISSMGLGPGGAYRAPRFITLKED